MHQDSHLGRFVNGSGPGEADLGERDAAEAVFAAACLDAAHRGVEAAGDAVVGQRPDVEALETVQADNSIACRFYAAMGGVEAGRSEDRFCGIPLAKIGFAWP